MTPILQMTETAIRATCRADLLPDTTGVGPGQPGICASAWSERGQQTGGGWRKKANYSWEKDKETELDGAHCIPGRPTISTRSDAARSGRQERVRLGSTFGLRAIVARLAVGLLASSTALVAVSFVPAAAVHTMVPAVGTSANFEVLDDAQYDVMPGLSCQNPTAPMPCYTPHQIRTASNMESVINGGTTGAGQ